MRDDFDSEEEYDQSDSRPLALAIKYGNSKATDGRSPNVLSGQKTKVPKPGLTLDDIRAGLGLSGSRPSSIKKSVDQNLALETENVPQDPSIVKLMNLALELFEFTQLLENSRAETAREWTEKSQVVRQFERLYDSVRDREALFRGKVAEQRKKFQIREGKYFNLKKRARQHLREWQADRDRSAIEAATSHARIEELTAELADVSNVLAEQKDYLLDLRSKAKNMPSEKEVRHRMNEETTDLNLKLRSLQNENSQLLTDRATLKLTLDELAASLQKRLPTPSTPESLTQVFNTAVIDETTRQLRSDFGESKNGRRKEVAAEIAQLERSAEELQDLINNQNKMFNMDVEELRRQRCEFEEYKSALEAMTFQPSSDEEGVEMLT